MSHTECIENEDDRAADEWFAFRVRPRHEKTAALQLREKGQNCFLPLVRKSRTWAKRIAYVDFPLFSGYVFCRSHRFGLLPILKTPGVVDVVRAGNSPVPIPTEEILALERAVNASIPMEPCPYIEIGRKVEIRTGPLSGVIGTVSDHRKPGQVVLSVGILRRSVLVHINSADVSDYGMPSDLSKCNLVA